VGFTARETGMTRLKLSILAIAGFCAIAATSAQAADRCRVTDPTGTQLNLRDAPLGKILAKVPNGRLVQMIETDSDRNGKTWARVGTMDGKPMGWVFREFVSCF
jgi:hypothetical protein